MCAVVCVVNVKLNHRSLLLCSHILNMHCNENSTTISILECTRNAKTKHKNQNSNVV